MRQSTIGAKAFDGRVRDGIGSYHLAKATRPAKNGEAKLVFRFSSSAACAHASLMDAKGGRRPRLTRGLISKRSRALNKMNLAPWRREPIKSNERLVPVSCARCRASTSGLSTWWSSTALQGRTRLEAGFPLRCLQRLSIPYIATLHCGWRHNRSTRDTFTPVLSY